MKSQATIEKMESERKALRFLAQSPCGAASLAKHMHGSSTTTNCAAARKMLDKFVQGGKATMREGLYTITEMGRSEL